MDVSVVIPVYNGEAYVADAVESALAQTLPPREVIVVNDGSTDRTQSILAAFGSRIRVISQPNRGLSAARNTGILAARGQWIGLLDADDTWRPHKLQRMSEFLGGTPSDVGVLFSAVLHWWEGSQRREVRRRKNPDCRGIWRELMARNAILGGGAGPVIRRECFRVVGLFDESLPSAEDWDMWIRIALCYRIGYLDDVLVERREHGASLSRNTDRMLASDIRVFEKHHDTFRARGASRMELRQAKAAVLARSAVAYFYANQIQKARRTSIQALSLDPLNIKALVPMAKLLLGMPHPGKAKA